MSSVSVFAPGRVELLGNHTDYNGGIVLSAAIHLGITATGRRRGDGKVVVSSEGISGVVAVDAGNIAAKDSWADYPLGVAKILIDAGYPVGGFEAEYASTLPLGAGLSSSAAIEVATAVLLTQLFHFEIDPLALAKLCRKAENEFVGVSCGLLDQVSSVFGKKDHAIYLDCRAETVESIPFPPSVGLLIVHSGVKHALTGGEYNERRSQCLEAAKLLGVETLRDATTARLHAAKISETIKHRALHITGENERVTEALDYLRAGDVKALGGLMTASHLSSIENFQNSTDELDTLVAIANAQPGVHGARLTGGGFGGAIVALTDLDVIEQVADDVVSSYLDQTGNRGAAYRCLVGDGAHVEA